MAFPVIQERKSITGESDQYQHPLYLQKDLRKNHYRRGKAAVLRLLSPSLFTFVLNLDETIHDAALQEEGVIIPKQFESQG